MKRLLPFAVLLTTSSAAIGSVDCAINPDRASGSGWRYRIIDSKRCWYQSEIALPKSELRWPSADSELPIIVLDEPLRPVLVQTVSYRAVEIQRREDSPLVSTRLMIFWGWIVAAFGIVISMMVGIVRGRG